MRKVVFAMGISLDGYIAGPGGDINWTDPDPELFRFHLELADATNVDVYGRRLYEVMRYWEEERPSDSEDEVEWGRQWRARRRIVFSRTLRQVEGGAELATGEPADVIAELKAQPGGEIDVGGATLAASLIERDLIDEYRLFVYPIVIGEGTPYFPPLPDRRRFRLTETRTFRASGVVFLRYERAT